MSVSGLFITGSDTGVGKTQVAAALAHVARLRGRPVFVRKPVESGGGDAEILRGAAGGVEPIETVRRYLLRTPVSPERAARLEGVRIRLADAVGAARAPGFAIVEGAGGFLSPLCEGALTADLAKALGFPLLVVVPDRLGAINQALLACDTAKARGLGVAAIVLNGGAENAEDIARWSGRPVVRVPRVEAPEPWRRLADHLRAPVDEGIIPLP